MAANTSEHEDTGSTTSTTLSADKPLDSPADDKLGYAPFAKAVAQAIARMEPADGMVVAVNGAWGLGKSTIINFIKHELAAARPDDLIVLPFNPWWYSGRAEWPEPSSRSCAGCSTGARCSPGRHRSR